jgi:hypothetical protein
VKQKLRIGNNKDDTSKNFSLIVLFPHFIVKKRQQIKNSGEKSKQFSPLLK